MAAASRTAAARSASGLRADRTQGTGRPARAPDTAGAGAGGLDGAGGSARITWALVPLIPKAEIPARRGRTEPGQGRAACSSLTARVTSPADGSVGRAAPST